MEEQILPAKSKRLTFWLAMSETLSVVTLVVAAMFFCVMSFGFYTYAKWSVPFVLAVASAVACAFPLLLFLPERTARTIHYLGGSQFAEKIFRGSLRLWQAVVGQNGPGVTGKMALLAQFLVERGKVQEAESLYDRVLKRLASNTWKCPSRAESSLKFYRAFLQSQSRDEDCASVTVALSRLRKQSLPAKIVFVLLPLPVVAYLSCAEVLVRAIAIELSQNHAGEVRRYVDALAACDSWFFGTGTGARVYCDYASSLYDAPAQQNMVLGFARSGVGQLSPGQSPYLSSKLNTIIGNVQMLQGDDNQARESFKLAVDSGLLPGQYDRYDNGDEQKRHVVSALTWLGDLELQCGAPAKAESMYSKALQRLEKLGESKSDEYLGLLDRLSTLASAKGDYAAAAAAKAKICGILESRLAGIVVSNMTPEEVEQHRRFTRELEACSVLLKQSGQVEPSVQLAHRAEDLRTQRVRPLLLNLQQQREIVDATTRATEHLLSVKYKATGWQKNLDLLMESEMKSNRARGALDGLSWLSPCTKDNGLYVRKIEIDMQPMKVRNFREPNTLAVDVTGTVRIQRRTGANDEPFAFAYLLKRIGHGPPVIEAVAEN